LQLPIPSQRLRRHPPPFRWSCRASRPFCRHFRRSCRAGGSGRHFCHSGRPFRRAFGRSCRAGHSCWPFGRPFCHSSRPFRRAFGRSGRAGWTFSWRLMVTAVRGLVVVTVFSAPCKRRRDREQPECRDQWDEAPDLYHPTSVSPSRADRCAARVLGVLPDSSRLNLGPPPGRQEACARE
jgi:hypothetical protein